MLKETDFQVKVHITVSRAKKVNVNLIGWIFSIKLRRCLEIT
jgi:hypothetical protein